MLLTRVDISHMAFSSDLAQLRFGREWATAVLETTMSLNSDTVIASVGTRRKMWLSPPGRPL